MALHKHFFQSPYIILAPDIRWGLADDTLQKIAVKVIDVFGNDTMKVMEVKI